MTKEEKIKEAYGDYWEKVKDHLYENGWTKEVLNSIPCDTKEMHIVFGHPEWWYRPKSLQGIEHNNGWIKIESTDDLPKTSQYCWIETKDDMLIALFVPHKGVNGVFVDNDQTYYKPEDLKAYKKIDQPKPPIY